MTNVIDWLLDLFRDPVRAQEFIADPGRSMAAANVSNVTAAQVQSVAATVAPAAVLHGGGDPVVGLQQAVAQTHGIAFAPQRQTEVLSNNDTLSHNDTRFLSPETNTYVDRSLDLDFGDFTFGDKTTNTATNGGVVVDGDNDGDILTDGSVKQDGDDNTANTGDIDTGDGSPVVIGEDNEVENSNQQAGGDIIADNEGPVVNDTAVGGGGGAAGGDGGHGGGILTGGGGDGGNASGGSGGVLVIEDNDTTTTTSMATRPPSGTSTAIVSGADLRWAHTEDNSVDHSVDNSVDNSGQDNSVDSHRQLGRQLRGFDRRRLLTRPTTTQRHWRGSKTDPRQSAHLPLVLSFSRRRRQEESMTQPSDPRKVTAGEPARQVKVIVELIDHTSKIADANERGDLVERLARAKDRITDPQIRVVVAGQLKQGKSQLLNSLLNVPVARVGDDESTVLPTVVSYSENAAAKLIVARPDGAEPEAIEIPMADIKTDLRRAPQAGGREVLRVEVTAASPLLKNGLAFVDTPGVGGHGQPHLSATLGLLPDADALLMCTDTSQEFTEPEMTFMRQAFEICPVATIIATKTDLYPHWRQIVEANKAHLDRAGLSIPMIPSSSVAAQPRDPAQRQGTQRGVQLPGHRQVPQRAGAVAAERPHPRSGRRRNTLVR